MDRQPSELDQKLAAELDHARDMLTMMGDELADNALIMREHSFAVQAIDIVSQMLGHIATVVRSEDRADAVDNIGMCELRAKLKA